MGLILVHVAKTIHPQEHFGVCPWGKFEQFQNQISIG
jgi:hypothetical protein